AILAVFLAVNAARAASVYPILSAFSGSKVRIPRPWKNVAMLGGMKGALSIVLVSSVPAALTDNGKVTTMVLGVAFLSITLQGSLLFRYADSKFPRSHRSKKSESEAKLTSTLAELEEIRKMREKGDITEDEFASWMGRKEKELADLVEEMRVTNQTEKVLRSRWKGIRSFFNPRVRRKRR
ncbi:MAG: cation:proton antiporter, partial [Nitrososphaerota archaeon]|nr:cation:proton antiporter [Nitrososphaerota archaeon]